MVVFLLDFFLKLYQLKSSFSKKSMFLVKSLKRSLETYFKLIYVYTSHKCTYMLERPNLDKTLSNSVGPQQCLASLDKRLTKYRTFVHN